MTNEASGSVQVAAGDCVGSWVRVGDTMRFGFVSALVRDGGVLKVRVRLEGGRLAELLAGEMVEPVGDVPSAGSQQVRDMGAELAAFRGVPVAHAVGRLVQVEVFSQLLGTTQTLVGDLVDDGFGTFALLRADRHHSRRYLLGRQARCVILV